MRRTLLVCLVAACEAGSSPTPDALAANDVTAVPPPLLFTDAVELWLDAAEAGTVIAPAGTVERWADRSAHGRDASSRSVATAPARSTLAGMTAVTFDGADDQLLAQVPWMPNRTLFMVGATRDAILPLPDQIGTLVSTTSCPPANGGITIAMLASTPTQRRVDTLGQFSHHLRVDGTGDGKDVTHDRWFVASLQMFPDNTGPALSLGSYVDGCRFGHVSIGELIVLDRGVAINQLFEIERYLAEKWHVPL